MQLNGKLNGIGRISGNLSGGGSLSGRMSVPTIAPGGGGDYYITTESANSVGYAVVGEAVTAEPNYTPSGVVQLNGSNVGIVTDASLDYEIINYTLNIKGVKLRKARLTIPTEAEFIGYGVTFEVKEKTE